MFRQQCAECTHGALPSVQHGCALVDCFHSSSVELNEDAVECVHVISVYLASYSSDNLTAGRADIK